MVNKKSGFTLTEMLIALVVIGIVASVLTPILVNLMPNQNKVIMKRSYYVITNTVAKMLEDDKLYSPFGGAGTGQETTVIYSGFDNTNAVNFNGKTYSGEHKFSGIFTAIIGGKDLGTESFNTLYRRGPSSVARTHNVDVAQTKDGIKWRFEYPGSSMPDMAAIITVDVNGDKGPNCSEGDENPAHGGRTKDFDRYVVGVYNDGHVQVSLNDSWARGVLNASSSFNGQ